MATTPLWDQHRVTDCIREILRSAPIDTRYGTGRAFLTTYQIAIEFARRFPQIAAALEFPTGGEGQGAYALTTYIAKWLPIRIHRGAADIELRFLSSQHLASLEFDDQGATLTATTNQSGSESTMFRLVEHSTQR